ncbi:hypothetical protein pb186bvf_015877 [Paramecium bursaria]
MSKSLGVFRNKTHLLLKYKDDQKQQINRFNKSNDLPIQKGNPLLNKPTTESTSSSISLELQPKTEWTIVYDDTIDKLKQVKDIIRELQVLGQKRVKKQFGDASVLEQQIYENNKKATAKIQECEHNVDKIRRFISDAETDSDRIIRENMQRALAQQIQDLTNSLRNQQKRMVTMINQIKNQDGGDFLKFSDSKSGNNDNDLTQQEEMMYDELTQNRDQEINNLVSMINDLAEVFKSLNQLVVDQGSILDRIDYNIDQTLHNVKKANIQLKKADEYQNSPLARRCIVALLAMIVVFCIILTIKYSR